VLPDRAFAFRNTGELLIIFLARSAGRIASSLRKGRRTGMSRQGRATLEMDFLL
jgi:hypothetical protein